MSCWVVPSIAAELWGVSTESVLEALRVGQIGSKTENGFTFIDVAPNSPVLESSRPASTPLPPTYRVLTQEEITALNGTDDEAGVENWRAGRAEAGLIRRPPHVEPDSDALAA